MGGLTGVNVLIMSENREVQGWRSITEPGKLHDTVAARNSRHLNQAAPTPIGHGVGYNIFHGEDRHDTAKKVLNRELKWEHPMEEVNQWIAHLQRAYSEEELKEEIDAINRPITTEDFRKYFGTKQESTKSSPSG